MEGTGRAMRIGEVLVARGLVTEVDVEKAVSRQRKEGGGRIGTHLVALGALTVDQLLTALRNQQDTGGALELCENTLRRSQAVHGPSHPNSYRARYNLARALQAAGRMDEAADHAEAALSGQLRALGAGHAWTRDLDQLVSELRLAKARLEKTAAAADSAELPLQAAG